MTVLLCCVTLALAISSAPAQDPGLRMTLVMPTDAADFDGRGPLAVQVEVLHPADLDDAVPNKPLQLGLAAAGWSKVVTVRVFDPAGKLLDWQLQPSDIRQTGPLTLVAGHPAQVGFQLAADTNRQLPRGDYTLRARLRIDTGEPWRGEVESAPLILTVGRAEPARAHLQLRLCGDGALAPGDPWVFALTVPPPLTSVLEPQLRGTLGADGYRGEPYRLRLHGGDGRELVVTFAPLAAPPSWPDARALARHGFGPLLATLGPATTSSLAAGAYRLSAEWRSADDAPARRGELSFTVATVDAARTHPGRSAAQLVASTAYAQALLWHGQYGNSAHVERCASAAADALLRAEQLARDWFATDPSTQSAAAFAEVCRLQESFDDALVFKQLAVDLWVSGAEAKPTTFVPLAELLRAPGTRADELPGGNERATRISPYLRAALARAQPAPPKALDPVAPGASKPRDGVSPPPVGDLQWASAARASSQYRTRDYSAAQAIGAPDVLAHGDSRLAWTPATKDGGEEWLELTYPQPVHATAVRVVQSYHPGAVQRIELIDQTGGTISVWHGPDSTAYPRGQVGVLAVTFLRTDQKVAVVKVWLDTKPGALWREIDAVALIGGLQ